METDPLGRRPALGGGVLARQRPRESQPGPELGSAGGASVNPCSAAFHVDGTSVSVAVRAPAGKTGFHTEILLFL